jgi:serine phosphatase RsbU (regulator of sigma subunit)
VRLRGQLIVAFLLLAIAPLAAVTAYSYYTWERTYKASNEAEAADLAAQMGTRMEPLTGELTRRIGRIRERQNPSRSPEHEQARREALAEAERAESRQILLGILAQSTSQADEVAFGLDAQGQLYVRDLRRRAEIEALGLAPLPEGTAELRRTIGDWVVVLRRDPASGLTLGIARPLADSVQQSRRTALNNLALGLGMLSVALLGILPLSRRMTRNLRALTVGAERLAKGDLQVRVPLRSRDEFGELAQTFNKMAEDLAIHQVQLLAQERLKKELELCRQIQQEFLPHGPLALPFARVDGVSVQAREVGGDFFSYFERPRGDVAIVVGDVAGKGVPAALLMANTQATLRANMIVAEDLAVLVDRLDRDLEKTTLPFQYVTMFLGLFDGHRLRYVNAGHNPPLVLRANGSHEVLDPTGRPVALLAGGGYEEQSVDLGEGDALLAFTDGVVEAEDRHGEPFGLTRLREVLMECRSAPTRQLLSHVQAAVHAHQGRREAADDATLLVLEPGNGLAA